MNLERALRALSQLLFQPAYCLINTEKMQDVNLILQMKVLNFSFFKNSF